MIAAKIFFTILEVLFFVGMAGSALVVILTSVDDLKELRKPKEPETSRTIAPLNHSEPQYQ